jgi:hypothetical protein
MHFFCVVLSRLEAPTVVAEAKKTDHVEIIIFRGARIVWQKLSAV